MDSKENFLCDIKSGETVKLSLMVMKIIYKDASKTVCMLADKSGEIKANIHTKNNEVKEGKVLEVEGTGDRKGVVEGKWVDLGGRRIIKKERRV